MSHVLTAHTTWCSLHTPPGGPADLCLAAQIRERDRASFGDGEPISVRDQALFDGAAQGVQIVLIAVLRHPEFVGAMAQRLAAMFPETVRHGEGLAEEWVRSHAIEETC